MGEIANESLIQSVSDVAKNVSVSFSLEGWPAAFAFSSIPAAFVLICAIRALVPVYNDV